MPVLQLENRNLTEAPRVVFAVEPQLGYWIARAWPFTRSDPTKNSLRFLRESLSLSTACGE